LRDGAHKPRAIEDDERSIVSKVAKKFYRTRLFVPIEIRNDLVDFARREHLTG